MTRRDVMWTAAAAGAALASAERLRPAPAEAPLIVPLRRIMDARAKVTPEQLRRFWWSIWPETVRDFKRCGIQLQTSDVRGEVRLSPGDRPIFVGPAHGVINLVLTDRIPMRWDSGRALPGVTTLYDGCYLCVMALRYAHSHQAPYLSVNTCVHELLHVLLQDIFVRGPKWYQADGREFRIDWYATQLWLFGGGATIRRSARSCLGRITGSSEGRSRRE